MILRIGTNVFCQFDRFKSLRMCTVQSALIFHLSALQSVQNYDLNRNGPGRTGSRFKGNLRKVSWYSGPAVSVSPAINLAESGRWTRRISRILCRDTSLETMQDVKMAATS